MPDYVDPTRSTCSTQPNVRSSRTARPSWSFNSTIIISLWEMIEWSVIKWNVDSSPQGSKISFVIAGTTISTFLSMKNIGQIHRSYLLYTGRHLWNGTNQSHREQLTRTSFDSSVEEEHFGSITIKITRDKVSCLRFDNVSFMAGNDSGIEDWKRYRIKRYIFSRWRSASLEMRFSTRFNQHTCFCFNFNHMASMQNFSY